jgi:hypothetical protein
VGFDITDQVVIRFSAFVRYCRTKGKCNEIGYQLSIDFRKAYDSGGRNCTTFSENLE